MTADKKSFQCLESFRISQLQPEVNQFKHIETTKGFQCLCLMQKQCGKHLKINPLTNPPAKDKVRA